MTRTHPPISSGPSRRVRRLGPVVLLVAIALCSCEKKPRIAEPDPESFRIWVDGERADIVHREVGVYGGFQVSGVIRLADDFAQFGFFTPLIEPGTYVFDTDSLVGGLGIIEPGEDAPRVLYSTCALPDPGSITIESVEDGRYTGWSEFDAAEIDGAGGCMPVGDRRVRVRCEFDVTARTE